MAVKIKLKRLGKIHAPQYRIVVADARTKRDGRAIEEIGQYRPKENPSFIQVDSERVQHWLSVGAQPTGPVAAILRVTGDWQKFKGLTAPAPMRVAEPKADKRAAFEAAAKDAANEPKASATTPKAKKSAKADAKTDVKADKAEKTEAEGTAESAETQASTSEG